MYKHTNTFNFNEAIRLLKLKALSLAAGNGDDWVQKVLRINIQRTL